jgi:hypothetical protein
VEIHHRLGDVGQIAGHAVTDTDTSLTQSLLSSCHLGAQLGTRVAPLRTVLTPKDDGLGEIMLEQVLRIIEVSLGEPPGTGHRIAINQHGRAHLTNYTARLPHLPPKSCWCIN